MWLSFLLTASCRVKESDEEMLRVAPCDRVRRGRRYMAAVMSVVSARLRNGIHPRGVEAKTTLTQVKLLVVHEDRDGGKGQQVRDEHDKGKRAER